MRNVVPLESVLTYLSSLTSEVNEDKDPFDRCHEIASREAEQIWRRIKVQKKQLAAPPLQGIDLIIVQKMENDFPVLRGFEDFVADRARHNARLLQERRLADAYGFDSKTGREHYRNVQHFQKLIKEGTDQIRLFLREMQPLKHCVGDMLGNMLYDFVTRKEKTPD
jgi:hypothetical protein